MRRVFFRLEGFSTCTFLILTLSGCGGGSVGAGSGGGNSSSSQIVSMSINTQSASSPTQQDLQNAANLAIGAGVKGVLLTWTWSELEPSPGVFDLSQLQPAIQYFSASGFKILLGIQVIDTVAKEVPSDLQTVAFDSPQMMSRFHALLDQITPSLASNVKYISIGNEVDVYLSSNPTEWTPYQAFYEDGLAYLHQKAPGIQIGVTETYPGFSGATKAQVSELNQSSDVVILTYYPLHGDYQVNSPESPATDFPTIVALSGGKPVVLQEVGYPSGSLNGSSEAMEAEFVTSALEAWHSAGSDIPYFNYFLEYDFSQTECDTFVQFYGLPNDAAFGSFLCSLGLRHSDGTAKPAWSSFVAGAQ
ncbi:MAG: hypothetical protein ACLQLR_09360 [Methanoregula sp.]